MREKLLLIVGLFALLYAAGLAWQTARPLADGVSKAWPTRQVPALSVRFLADRTYLDAAGQRQTDQEIYDEVLQMIAGAQRYILVDFFLYNAFQGNPPERTRALSADVTETLIAKKQALPDIDIVVVSDPINTVYGGVVSPEFTALEAAGIPVVLTDLAELRDSNPTYAVLWRTVGRWFGNSSRGGSLPHPFQFAGPKVTARSWLALLNFKANHRKLIVADQRQADGSTKLVTLVTSANPHDGSSAHGNVAISVTDGLWQDAVASERAVGAFSGRSFLGPAFAPDDAAGEVTVQLLTEGAIRERAVELIDSATEGDAIAMAMFYLSERSLVDALAAAAERGATVRLLLDPNRDAFGHTKNGVPNRPVAHELLSAAPGNVSVRWCDTHGEQCHAKLLLVRSPKGQAMLAGSANFTRRNIGDYNLETDVFVSATTEISAIAAAQAYFDEVWDNEAGRHYSVPYDEYADASMLKTIMYRVQEATGLSSF